MRKVLVGCFASGAMLLGPELLSAADPPAAAGASADAPAASSPNGELFDRLDANHDGQLEASEIPAEKQRLFQRLLRAADKDSSGTLSRTEFVAGLEDRRPERPLEEKDTSGMAPQGGLIDIAEIFARLDANKDGKITRDEIPAEVRERFEQLLVRGDKNSDGILTKEEGNALAESYKPPKRPAQGADPAVMFRYLDTDGDGKVALSEVPGERREGFEKLLAHFDKDGDGKLNEQEFTAGMKAAQLMRAGETPAPGSPAGTPPGKGENSPNDKPGKRPLAKFLADGLDPEKATQRLMHMDKNKDGKLSREEAERLGERFFNNFDTNQDGFVEGAEIRARLDQLKKERGQ